jgi:hypothetical protein
MGLLSWMEATSFSNWILASAVGWPFMLSLHAIGLATIVGIVFALALRLLGIYRTIPCSALEKFVFVAWLGVALNVFTGFSIFMSQATYYITNVPFLMKITFILIGCGTLWYTQKVLKRDAAGWDAAGTIPAIGVQLASGLLVFWTLSVVMGRLIAYL